MSGYTEGAHDSPADTRDRLVRVGSKYQATPPSVADGDNVYLLTDAAGRPIVKQSHVGGEVTSVVVAIGASSATRATAINPTAGKKVRIISVEAQAFGLTTDPDAVYVYFGSGAAYTTNAASAIAALYTGTKGSDNRVWPDDGGPVGAADDDVSWRTETETETQRLLTVHYREE